MLPNNNNNNNTTPNQSFDLDNMNREEFLRWYNSREIDLNEMPSFPPTRNPALPLQEIQQDIAASSSGAESFQQTSFDRLQTAQEQFTRSFTSTGFWWQFFSFLSGFTIVKVFFWRFCICIWRRSFLVIPSI